MDSRAKSVVHYNNVIIPMRCLINVSTNIWMMFCVLCLVHMELNEECKLLCVEYIINITLLFFLLVSCVLFSLFSECLCGCP